MNILGYRKLIAYLFSCAITGGLSFVERIESGTFEVVMVGLAGAFFAANVAGKFGSAGAAARAKADNPTS